MVTLGQIKDIVMKQIRVPIDDDAASLWNNASERDRRNASRLVSSWLKNILPGSKRDRLKKEFFENMREAGEIAKANGLTPKILERLLNEKD